MNVLITQTSNIRSAFILVFLTIMVVSCTHDPEDDYWPILLEFDSLIVEPNELINGVDSNIRFSVLPHYSGRGLLRIEGRGGGHSIGKVIVPISGEFGSSSVEAHFRSELPFDANWVVSFYDSLNIVGINAVAYYDSIVINDVLYDINAREVHEWFGDDYIFIIGQVITLNRRGVQF